MKLGTPGRSARPGKFVCTKCQKDKHHECIDLLRATYTTDKVCQCSKHSQPVPEGTQPNLVPITGAISVKKPSR